MAVSHSLPSEPLNTSTPLCDGDGVDNTTWVYPNLITVVSVLCLLLHRVKRGMDPYQVR